MRRRVGILYAPLFERERRAMPALFYIGLLPPKRAPRHPSLFSPSLSARVRLPPQGLQHQPNGAVCIQVGASAAHVVRPGRVACPGPAKEPAVNGVGALGRSLKNTRFDDYEDESGSDSDGTRTDKRRR